MAQTQYLISAHFKEGPQGLEPALLHGFEVGRIDFTPGYPLSDGRAFFVIVVTDISETAFRHALGPTASVLGQSYTDLYNSDCALKEEIFRLEGTRRRVKGTPETISLPISGFVQGDILVNDRVQPPVVFAGEPVDSLPLWESAKTALLFRGEAVQQSASPNTTIFLCHGLGVRNVPSGVVEIGDITWRAAALYGLSHPIFALGGSTPDDFAPMFTGALEFRMPNDFSSMHGASRLRLIQNARARVARIFAALSTFCRVSSTVVAEVAIGISGAGSFSRPQALSDLRWTKGVCPHTANVSLAEFRRAVSLAVDDGGKLSRQIQFALDALATASLTWDRRIGYILLWSGIEALATMDNRDNLATNIALAVLGAQGPDADSYARFKGLKDAYGRRSGLVHGFRVDEADVTEDCAITFEALRSLVLAASAEVADGRQDADAFRSKLVARALAKS